MKILALCVFAFLTDQALADASQLAESTAQVTTVGTVPRKPRVSHTPTNWIQGLKFFRAAETIDLPVGETPTEERLCAAGLAASCPSGLTPIGVEIAPRGPEGPKTISFALVPEKADLT